uniref:Heterodimeric geranylgeranyl pyrophosphate synthase n=1 Tax=Stevia rebaudiana TaxID=55670 RepID=A0A8K1P934_STERE|nr:heterodimeric geranylgeranyl pyrophosphate synthase [Stevia rebaudiana]
MAGFHLPLYRTNLIRSSSSPAPSAYTKPTVVTQNLSYWNSIYSDIESHLKKVIPIRDPVSIFEPMHHLTFAPPRTTAPALCVAACEAVGGNREDAIVAASAIHLMHATIYTHDHLLLTDRVGREPESEIPHRFGTNIELLIADGIMPFGFELLAGSAGDNSEKILKVIVEITGAIGSQEMVAGEDGGVGRPAGLLHGCGAACGAIIGGGNVEEIDRLKRFGLYVGKIQGLLSEKSKNEGCEMELLETWRALALKELEYFDSRKVEQISSIVGV